MTLLSPIFWIIGYLSGSLPFAVWISRRVKGVDLREGGSGHMTTTNTIRQAGWAAGAAVYLLDTAKGFLPVYFAIKLGLPAWSIAITATLALVGHCWPVFAQFRGGMGLAGTAGALLAIFPPAFLLAVVVLILFLLVTHHGARGSLIAVLAIPVLFWLLGWRGTLTWVSIPMGLVLAGRYTIDWNRKYRELWLDREKAPKPEE